ncbi:H-NS family nucleoid-associated regulatory protein [Achromobacter kerstersii]
MTDCGLTIENVQNALARDGRRSQAKSVNTRGHLRPVHGPRRTKDHEFRDPQTGDHWTGWGPRPASLRAHLEASRSIEDFKVAI